MQPLITVAEILIGLPLENADKTSPVTLRDKINEQLGRLV